MWSFLCEHGWGFEMAGLLTRLKRLHKRFDQINEIAFKVDELQKAVGHIEARMTRQELVAAPTLHDYEFKVFSQWGEDGIIQYLLRNIEIPRKHFVEFGVYDYRESNTRFLLQNDNWSGLILDSSSEFMQRIKQDPMYFRNDLRAVSAFITRENINEVLTANGVSDDIGLLSIDIDGNDYWVWEAINCISPRIVICEYDSLLGATRKVTTPYKADFDRLSAHYSFLYGGASIAALHALAVRKGYTLVGSNSAGNNAFFVRNNVLGALRGVTPQEAYVKAKFRNSHDEAGKLTFLGFEDAVRLIADMPLHDLETNALVKVRDIHPFLH
jgi:hypothetical protein